MYCGNKEFNRPIWAYTNVGEVEVGGSEKQPEALE